MIRSACEVSFLPSHATQERKNAPLKNAVRLVIASLVSNGPFAAFSNTILPT